MKKCVHTISIDNWFPEMCNITLPLIKRYADRIGADFNIISKAKFDGFPPNYEKMQIWESGKDCDWNIYLDADMIIDPDKLQDFSQQNPRFFHYESHILNNVCFNSHPYFIRDGRNLGVSDCFLATSSYTHDLWYPTSFTLEEIQQYCLINKRMVSEFVISLNIARFGLKGLEMLGSNRSHFHLQTTDDYGRMFNKGKSEMTKEEHIIRALETIKRMEIRI